VAKLEAVVERRNEKLRILEDLATELQREMSQLRAGVAVKAAAAPNAGASSAE